MTPPRLTIVVPVDGEGRVRETISSVLDQPPAGEAELVALKVEVEARLPLDPRARVVGVDSDDDAWPAGLGAAAGDYVWFLRPGDTIAPGALLAVAARLGEFQGDLLLVGESQDGPERQRFRRETAGATFSAAGRPRTLELATGLADKIFRRAFLLDLDARVVGGPYGEVPLTYAALLTARLGTLDARCVIHGGGETAPPDARAAVKRFEEVAAWLARHGFDTATREAVAATALRQLLRLYDDVPPRDRDDFVRRIGALYEELDGPRPRSFAARVALRGRSRSYASVRALARRRARVHRASTRVRAAARTAPARVRRNLLTSYYRLQLRRPIDAELAAFAAYWYRDYSCNPRAIHEKLREVAPQVRGVWIVERRHADRFPANVDHVIARTRAYYRLIARAGWFVNNVGFPEDVVKRPGTVRIHTHHGTPIKTMGLDQLGSFVGGRVDREGQLRRVARWDYSVSQSPFATRTWERAYPGAYRTLEVGHPRNDRLATSTTDDVARIRDQLGIAPGVRTVLYAPTHREYLPKLDAYLDPDRFAAGLGPEYLVLHRLHFLVRGRRPEAGGATLDVTEYGSVEDLYLAADVLVTDYSSVLFDFAVLDRPIAVYAPDWEVYSALRGVYFDLPAQPPGIVATTQESLVEAFRSGAVDGEEAARLRSTFRATFCPHDDGRAAERVVREVWTPRVVPGASEGRTALVTMGAGVRRA